MKYNEAPRPHRRLEEAESLGKNWPFCVRLWGRQTQADAAARAGISRSTAVLIEAGDESHTLAQLLRYLNALAADTSLLALLTGDVPALRLMQAQAIPNRVKRSATVKTGQPHNLDVTSSSTSDSTNASRHAF